MCLRLLSQEVLALVSSSCIFDMVVMFFPKPICWAMFLAIGRESPVSIFTSTPNSRICSISHVNLLLSGQQCLQDQQTLAYFDLAPLATAITLNPFAESSSASLSIFFASSSEYCKQRILCRRSLSQQTIFRHLY